MVCAVQSAKRARLALDPIGGAVVGARAGQRAAWTVLVPLRALPSAKARLAATLPVDAHASLHADVVAAIRADTLASVTAAPGVARVVVIGDLPGPGVTLVQTSPGLNGALRDGAEFAARQWPEDGVAAIVGDLPALQPEELAAALDAAARHRAAFVPDRTGQGTTLLTAAPGRPLRPQFGPGSAARHAAAATRVEAGPGLRHDVDTAADLHEASLGVGPRTAAVLCASGLSGP